MSFTRISCTCHSIGLAIDCYRITICKLGKINTICLVTCTYIRIRGHRRRDGGIEVQNFIVLQGAIQQLDAVEVGGVGDAVDFVAELYNLFLKLGAVGLVLKGAVGGLLGQLVHAVEHVVDLGEGALGGLHQGDTVLGVVLGLVQAGDLGAHLLGDGQTRGVVAGPVDLIAGRQLLQVLGQGAGVVGVVAVGVHRHDVVLNTHDLYSSLMFCGQVPSCPALISQPPQAFTAAKRSC